MGHLRPESDFFHTHERFILKREFWRSTMCYEISDYSIWLLTIVILFRTACFYLLERFGPHETRKKLSVIITPGSRDPGRISDIFLEKLVCDRRKCVQMCRRDVNAIVTTER